MELIEKLRSGETIDEPIAVVVAHPDDETVGIGSRLRRITDLTLIHMTDGAPRGPANAQRAGFADWRAYAEAREQELACALDVLGASGAARCAYGFPDQAAVFHVDEIAERLAHELPRVEGFHGPDAGRGRALTRAWLSSNADVSVYMDIDLSTGLEALPPLIDAIATGRADVASGTRLGAGAQTCRRGVATRRARLLLPRRPR